MISAPPPRPVSSEDKKAAYAWCADVLEAALPASLTIRKEVRREVLRIIDVMQKTSAVPPIAEHPSNKPNGAQS